MTWHLLHTYDFLLVLLFNCLVIAQKFHLVVLVTTSSHPQALTELFLLPRLHNCHFTSSFLVQQPVLPWSKYKEGIWVSTLAPVWWKSGFRKTNRNRKSKTMPDTVTLYSVYWYLPLCKPHELNKFAHQHAFKHVCLFWCSYFLELWSWLCNLNIVRLLHEIWYI